MLSVIEIYRGCIASIITRTLLDPESILTMLFPFHFFCILSDFGSWCWTCALPFHNKWDRSFADKMCSSVGILHLHPFIWGMYLSSCWSSFELLGSVFSCTICSWSQPLPFRWQLLLDTEAWWMWSRNLGAICAHSVAGALTSKLSVSKDTLGTYFFRVSSLAYPNLLGKKGYVVVVVVCKDTLGTLWECYFHYDIELCCAMWWLYFLRCSLACFVQCCLTKMVPNSK